MKLTNISLAILVALGLAACGGSDDNTPQTSDNQEAGHKNQTPTGGDDKKKNDEEIKKNDDNIDPTRKAADLTVKPALVDAVNADKKVLISNQFGDDALGYKTGNNYDEDKSTSPGNVKFTTTYNFSEEGDLFTTDESIGAIRPSDEPWEGKKQNAFVKGKSGKYYRVRAQATKLNDYDDKTLYALVYPITNAVNSNDPKVAGAAKAAIADVGYSGGMKIPQSKVVFVANADIKSYENSTSNNPEHFIVDPSKAPNAADSRMNAGLSQVILTKVSVLGDSYDPNAINQSLDLNKIPKDKITTTPVTGDITIVNTKNDGLSNDKVINRQIEVGHLKAYNLGYSIAYVGLDSSKENSKNIFNLVPPTAGSGDVNSSSSNPYKASAPVPVDGAYQVAGYKTLALPKDGRAIYNGKSFSESTEGDVKLVAEFFEDRASVKGLVNNRKNILDDNKALPTLTLQPIQLTSPTQHITTGSGTVTGDNARFNSWTVQFYGLEAEEAGGYIYGKDVEVYTTRRDELSNKSNTADTK